MKIILKVLVLCILIVTMISCSENGVLKEELTETGGRTYHNSELFTGTAFKISDPTGPITYNYNGEPFEIEHPYGYLKFETQYVDGLKHGNHVEYNEDGKIIKTSSWNCGELHGKLYMWTCEWIDPHNMVPSGPLILTRDYNYVNGKKHGSCIDYSYRLDRYWECNKQIPFFDKDSTYYNMGIPIGIRMSWYKKRDEWHGEIHDVIKEVHWGNGDNWADVYDGRKTYYYVDGELYNKD